MHPILFSIGPFTLKTYGLMVALAFAVSIVLAWKQAGREGIDSDTFLDMTLWIVIGGILGGRVLYVIVSWHEFVENVLDVFKIWQGGLIFYGGLFMSILAVILYCRKKQLSTWQILDICAPYAALGHAIGRLGCFFNGCCYGPVNTTWGVIFPSLGDNLPHLPTQLMESVANLLLFLGLLAFRPKRQYVGQLVWLYIFGYAVLRFGLEFLRGDEIRGSLLFSWLSTSQFIALFAMGLAGGMLIWLGRAVRLKS
ncbi:prolipoprotein diacylglyceryl transferase [bacterium]|nr:prolipoprotein diacylglyceryl transferase [bacterium]